MKWFKSYQRQGMECKKSGCRFSIEVPSVHYPKGTVNATVCTIFKTYCHSAACSKTRMEIGVDQENDNCTQKS